MEKNLFYTIATQYAPLRAYFESYYPSFLKKWVWNDVIFQENTRQLIAKQLKGLKIPDDGRSSIMLIRGMYEQHRNTLSLTFQSVIEEELKSADDIPKDKSVRAQVRKIWMFPASKYMGMITASDDRATAGI